MQADGELVQKVRKEQEEQGNLKSRVKVLEASLGEPIVSYSLIPRFWSGNLASADSAGKNKLYSLKSIYVLNQGLRIQNEYGQMLYTMFDSL